MSEDDLGSALILAAGRGSRLNGTIGSKPKCLAIVGGRPLLESQLTALEFVGIRDIHIVSGYGAEDLKLYKRPLVYNENWKTTTMVTSMLLGLSKIPGNRTVLVVYGDTYLSQGALTNSGKQNGEIALGFVPGWKPNWEARYDDPLDDVETFKVSDSGKVLEIGHQPQSLDEIQGQFGGVLKLSPIGREKIMHFGEMFSGDTTTSLLDRMINEGIAVGAFPLIGDWFEVDTPRDHAYADRSLSRGRE